MDQRSLTQEHEEKKGKQTKRKVAEEKDDEVRVMWCVVH